MFCHSVMFRVASKGRTGFHDDRPVIVEHCRDQDVVVRPAVSNWAFGDKSEPMSRDCPESFEVSG